MLDHGYKVFNSRTDAMPMKNLGQFQRSTLLKVQVPPRIGVILIDLLRNKHYRHQSVRVVHLRGLL